MTAVPITTRDRDALAIFAYRLVDERDVTGLVERTLARAGDEHAAGHAPAYTLRAWLLGLMVLEHTHHAPRPSRDLALVTAFTELPEEARAALWHLSVEGETVAVAASELGLDTSDVLAHARAGVSELRENVLAQFPPEGRPADCRWLHRRELEAPTVPLTKGELYRGEQHACACAWCGEMEDQLTLASDDLRKVMAVAALGSLAPLYLATRPQPVMTMVPSVPPAFTGLRRTVVTHRRPIIGAGAVATVAAAALGIALVNPVVPDEEVYSADGAIVEIRGDDGTGQGSVDGIIDLTGDGALGGGAGDGAGPGTATGTDGGTGAGAGPGAGGAGGADGGADGGSPGAGGSGNGAGNGFGNGTGNGTGNGAGNGTGDGSGDGGSSPDGGSDDGDDDRLLRTDVRLDPLQVDLGVGTSPLLGDDVEASAGLGGISLRGLVDLEIPLLDSTTTTQRSTSPPSTTQKSKHSERRATKAPRGLAKGWRGGSPGRSASTPSTTRSQRSSVPAWSAPTPPKASPPSTRGKAPAHSNAGGKGKPKPKDKDKLKDKGKVRSPAKDKPQDEKKGRAVVSGLVRGLLG